MGNVLDFSGFCGQRHVSMLETGARSPLQKQGSWRCVGVLGEIFFTIEILILPKPGLRGTLSGLVCEYIRMTENICTSVRD
jgi:hypothetical protein